MSNLDKQLGELGDIIHKNLEENGKDTKKFDETFKSAQDYLTNAVGKVEKSDDKEKTQNEIAEDILNKVKQFAGKNETNNDKKE